MAEGHDTAVAQLVKSAAKAKASLLAKLESNSKQLTTKIDLAATASAVRAEFNALSSQGTTLKTSLRELAASLDAGLQRAATAEALATVRGAIRAQEATHAAEVTGLKQAQETTRSDVTGLIQVQEATHNTTQAVQAAAQQRQAAAQQQQMQALAETIDAVVSQLRGSIGRAHTAASSSNASAAALGGKLTAVEVYLTELSARDAQLEQALVATHAQCFANSTRVIKEMQGVVNELLAADEQLANATATLQEDDQRDDEAVAALSVQVQALQADDAQDDAAVAALETSLAGSLSSQARHANATASASEQMHGRLSRLAEQLGAGALEAQSRSGAASALTLQRLDVLNASVATNEARLRRFADSTQAVISTLSVDIDGHAAAARDLHARLSGATAAAVAHGAKLAETAAAAGANTARFGRMAGLLDSKFGAAANATATVAAAAAALGSDLRKVDGSTAFQFQQMATLLDSKFAENSKLRQAENSKRDGEAAENR